MNSQPEFTPEQKAAAELWIETMQAASSVHDCMIGLWVALGDGEPEGVGEARSVLAQAAVALDAQLTKYVAESAKLEAEQPQPQEDKTDD